MSNNFQNTNQGSAMQFSLNMLKQMQERLKNEKGRKYAINRNPIQYRNNNTRYKTQADQFTHRPLINTETIGFNSSQKQQLHLRSPHGVSKHANTFRNSQPTMVENNQNDFISVKEVLKQNRRLKKYVNCLLQMNDYLKNQLVKKDSMMNAGISKMGHSFQLQIMRMEIQYLKQLNKDKQLQLKKSVYVSELKSQNNKKSQRQTINNNSDNSHRKKHMRSNSAYDGEYMKKSVYPHIHQSQLQNQQNGQYSDQVSSHRFMKSMQRYSNNKKDHKKSYSSQKKKSGKKDQQTNYKSSFKKNKNCKNEQSINKCRLCYL